ncbi:MAG: hypothetical protein AB8G05_15280 [Oligoflexales bacterium]
MIAKNNLVQREAQKAPSASVLGAFYFYKTIYRVYKHLSHIELRSLPSLALSRDDRDLNRYLEQSQYENPSLSRDDGLESRLVKIVISSIVERSLSLTAESR